MQTVFTSTNLVDFTKRSGFHMGQTYHMDGTFKTCLPFFQQLFTIHPNYRGHAFPLFYSLMTSKSNNSYVRLFQFIKTVIPEWSPRVISDYESGILSAVSQELRLSQHQGCWFHFCKGKCCKEFLATLSPFLRIGKELIPILARGIEGGGEKRRWSTCPRCQLIQTQCGEAILTDPQFLSLETSPDGTRVVPPQEWIPLLLANGTMTDPTRKDEKGSVSIRRPEVTPAEPEVLIVLPFDNPREDRNLYASRKPRSLYDGERLETYEGEEIRLQLEEKVSETEGCQKEVEERSSALLEQFADAERSTPPEAVDQFVAAAEELLHEVEVVTASQPNIEKSSEELPMIVDEGESEKPKSGDEKSVEGNVPQLTPLAESEWWDGEVAGNGDEAVAPTEAAESEESATPNEVVITAAVVAVQKEPQNWADYKKLEKKKVIFDINIQSLSDIVQAQYP
uniref:MULE transposase domain-containing protein n=1 Tax=Strigamia maritima TaxID=126957 RepID=T1IGT0_STRMM